MTDTDTDADSAPEDAESAPDNHDDNVCGEPTANGGECQRPAGFGIPDTNIGPCKDHSSEFRVPDKLNAETKSTLTGAASAGAKLEHCANLAGIARSTLWDWLSRGEDHADRGLDTELAELYRTFNRARAAGAVRRLENASDEFVLQASYGYTKQEELAIDHGHDADTDPGEAYIDALSAGLADDEDAVTEQEGESQ